MHLLKAALLLYSIIPPLLAYPFAPSTLSPRSALTDCLSSSSLSYLTPDSPNFSSSTQSFNARIQPVPQVIVFPSTPEQVAQAVQCAKARSIAVVARGGGHSYDNHRSCGQHCYDWRRFLTWRGFFGVEQSWESDESCYGPSSRKWFLTLDNIIAYDVILANSTVLRQFDASRDPNLFWALKGAAPSFGIVTTYYFKIYQRPSTVVVFTHTWTSLSVLQTTNLLLAFQTFGKTAVPSALGLKVVLSKGMNVLFGGSLQGNEQKYHELLDGFLATLPGGSSSSVKTLNWIGSLDEVAGGQPLSSEGASDYRDSFFTRSLMSPSSKPITSSAFSAFVNHLWNVPTTTNWFIETDLYGGLGSNINAHPLSTSSFGRRNSLLTFQMYASSPTFANPYPAAGIDWIKAAYEALVEPMRSTWGSNYGAYVNYADPTLTREEQKTLYWGTQYARLATLKKRFDPTNVFRNPQTIVGA